MDWVVDDDDVDVNDGCDGGKEFEGWVFLIFLLFDMVLEYI